MLLALSQPQLPSAMLLPPPHVSGVKFNDEGMATYKQPLGLARVEAPAGARPIVILPGFGNCSTDYEAPFGVAEGSLANNLRVRRKGLWCCRPCAWRAHA